MSYRPRPLRRAGPLSSYLGASLDAMARTVPTGRDTEVVVPAPRTCIGYGALLRPPNVQVVTVRDAAGETDYRWRCWACGALTAQP